MMKNLCPVCLILMVLFSCTPNTQARKDEAPKPRTEIPPDYLILTAVGDNLLHEFMIRRNPRTGAYDFDAYYGEVKSLIEPADIAFVNQETLLAGETYGFSGYPRFNTPPEAGTALAALGFDVVNQATNHVMDKGEGAVFATMDFWSAFPGVQYLGIYRSREERDTKKVIIGKNNITVGFLAYTYGTNGIPVPRDKPYLVSLIDEGIMQREITALRPLCDFLVVSMHWGEEYRVQPTREQERLARFLAGLEVDLIIGHHPHVLEPYVFLDRPGGGKTLCFYSLGNFLSGQQSSQTQLGGLAWVRIKKSNGGVSIDDAGIVPLVNHYEAGLTGFRVYPLYDYREALAEKHLLRLRGRELSVSWLTGMADQILGDGNILPENPFVKKD
jgi:poly-gamma-glutamate synthesis protein (capsule biosynthesis protein)